MSDDRSLIPIPRIPPSSDFLTQSFYKIVLPGSNTSGPKIPSAFLQHMKEEAAGVATLTVSGGGKWDVILLKEGKRLAFKDGWEKFYAENSLKITDLLIFKYHGHLKFNVDIFDRSGVKTH